MEKYKEYRYSKDQPTLSELMLEATLKQQKEAQLLSQQQHTEGLEVS